METVRPRHGDICSLLGNPGTPRAMHRVGGLEKDFNTSVISTDGPNHERMVKVRREKIARIANDIPELTVQGNPDADTVLVGWGAPTDIS